MHIAKEAIEFAPTIGDIYNSVSSIFHILRNFDRPIEPVNLAGNPQRIEK